MTAHTVPRRPAQAAAWLLTAVLGLSAVGLPQDQPPAKRSLPAVRLSVPLGVVPGEFQRLTLRGLALEGAMQVKCGDDRMRVKLLSSGKAPGAGSLPADRIGDTQVEIELAGCDGSAAELLLTVVTPAGESAPWKLPIRPPQEAEGASLPFEALVMEVEPNGGFKQVQNIACSQIVLGSIGGPQDVDVYAFDPQGQGGLVCEIFASRLGSGLDPLLTLYSERGAVLAEGDDLPDSQDARIVLEPAPAGRCLLVVRDANDQGSPAHPYRLVVRQPQPAGKP